MRKIEFDFSDGWISRLKERAFAAQANTIVGWCNEALAGDTCALNKCRAVVRNETINARLRTGEEE